MKYLIFVLLLIGCNSAGNVADRAMEQIMNGDLRLHSTGDGYLLMGDDIETSGRLIQHFFAEDGENYYDEDYSMVYLAVYDLPSSIEYYERIDVKYEKKEMLVNRDVSREYYNKWLSGLYESYNSYIDETLTECRNDPGCKYFANKKTISKPEKVPHKKYTYRAKTTSGMQKVSIGLYKERGKWGIGFIQTESI